MSTTILVTIYNNNIIDLSVIHIVQQDTITQGSSWLSVSNDAKGKAAEKEKEVWKQHATPITESLQSKDTKKPFLLNGK